MKIFALYTNLELQQSPNWFETFKTRFDYQYPLHVTLIQPRYIEDEKVEGLKLKVSKFLEENLLSKIGKELTFTNIFVSKEDDSFYTFMLLPTHATEIINFQKKLVNLLSEYDSYVKPENKKYETDFNPHVTVAVDVEESKLTEAQSYFSDDFIISGTITHLILPVVRDTSKEEALDQANLTEFDI